MHNETRASEEPSREVREMMETLFAEEADNARDEIRSQMEHYHHSLAEALEVIADHSIGHALPGQKSLKRLRNRFPETYRTIAREYLTTHISDASQRAAIERMVASRISMA